MEDKEIVVRLGTQAAEEVALFFERSKAPLALSEFLEACLIRFREFLREGGIFLQARKAQEPWCHRTLVHHLLP
jgi:hypothetical protein